MRESVLKISDQTGKIAFLRGLSSQQEDYSHYKEEKEKFDADYEGQVHGNKIDCEICELKAKVRHHIVPLSQGGLHNDSNILLICHYCHAKIHDWMTPLRTYDCNSKDPFDLVCAEIIEHDSISRRLVRNCAPGWEVARERQRVAESILKVLETGSKDV